MSVMLSGDQPVQMQCPNCQAMIQTMVRTECGMASIVCIVLGLFLFCPLLFVACCVMDAVHICPNCQMVVGCYKHC
ncbi:lipopolysaccharide-induced transcription factor regulating tumor necrosis factor alpha [Aphelenchoides avenae]|nr:lipopolysaccharide-induced transcription factor regulating tumor necrosis factor alpha [Aphelenchus avenae]